MPIYRVRFMKTVANDSGHERQVCQRAVEIEAETPEAALGPAQAVFCQLEGVADCSQRSDCCETEVVTAAPRSHTHAAKWPAVSF